jgi:acyl-CoA dehydrogenase
MQHAPFGSDVPYAEPAWYRGVPTPYYEEKHAAFREKVRAFVDEHLVPYADDWDEAGLCPIEELRLKAAEAGVLCPWAPEELGGTPPVGGWDEFMFVIWADEFGRCGAGGVAILFFITYMSLPHILNFGSDHLKETIARPIIAGKDGIAITLTEPQGGSDLANIQSTATKTADGKHYVISGSKKFITGGQCVGYFSTLVRTGDKGLGGLSMVLIPACAQGVTISKLKAAGWWAGNTTLVNFEDVKVPVENLIGSEGMGFMVMASAMNGERLIGCMGAIRAARILLSTSISFARERKTFGKKLSDSQVIRHKFAQMARRVEAAQCVVESLAFSMSKGAGPADIGGPMALAKVECTQAHEYCAREASQVLGGASFLRQGKGQIVERLSREVRVNVVGGGSEEIMLDLAMRMSKI